MTFNQNATDLHKRQHFGMFDGHFWLIWMSMASVVAVNYLYIAVDSNSDLD